MPGRTDIPFAIGSPTWTGLAKLAEECGELQQVIGKLMAFPEGDHPDGAGDLRSRLTQEMADVWAALSYVKNHNEEVDAEAMGERASMKYERFQKWHEDARAASSRP